MANPFGNPALRPDVQVVAHAQPFHAYLFSASLDPLRPFTVVADYFVDVPRPEDEVALMTTKEEAIALAVALGQRFAVLMRNYGVTFCGMPLAHAACVRIFLEKTWFRAKKPSPATRLKRHGQIMSPIHWEHSWNYFYRKLKVRGENADGIAAPLFG
jgi:L-fuculose-phosphate aldolase